MNLQLDDRTTTGAIDHARTRVPAGDRKLNIVVHVGGKQPAKKKPFCVVKKGSVEIPIYGRKAGPFTIAWYEGRSRKRAMRSDLEAAKKLAGEKATCVANGQSAMAGMDQKDWASYQRALEILQPTGQQLELAAGIYTQCVQKLAAVGLTIEDAVTCALQNARTNIVPKLCPEVVAEFLDRKRNNTYGKKIGPRWMRSLESQLETFAEYFTCPLAHVSSSSLDAWLSSMRIKMGDQKHPLSGRTRKNYRGAVAELIGYGKAMRYVPTTWDEMERVPAPDCGRVKKIIYTPEQLSKLLVSTLDNMIPFTAISAFAGVRHEEMNSEEAVLDWHEVNLKKKIIRILDEVSKTGDGRIIKMPDNLVAWLTPYARPSGPVCTVANTSNALYRAKKKAGLPAGKNESRNALRKSWESYRDALKQDSEHTSGEAGHSQAVAKRNYVKAQLEEDGQRWFNIWPSSADVIQLNLGLR